MNVIKHSVLTSNLFNACHNTLCFYTKFIHRMSQNTLLLRQSYSADVTTHSGFTSNLFSVCHNTLSNLFSACHKTLCFYFKSIQWLSQNNLFLRQIYSADVTKHSVFTLNLFSGCHNTFCFYVKSIQRISCSHADLCANHIKIQWFGLPSLENINFTSILRDMHQIHCVFTTN